VDAIVLDLGLPDLDGFTLLERLADAPATRDIPVVICTSRPLSDAERGRLAPRAFRILDKSEMHAHVVAAAKAACAPANPGREEAA
jgi:CheY-like chemotaxis protein